MSPNTKTPLLENGTILNGKWEILEHIATGGKGEVYCARQTNLNREVVVKTVSTEYLAEFGDDLAEVETEIQRFHREASAMAQIRHPYVVQVYDQDSATIVKNGEEITVQYVVMEYVPGNRTLRQTMPLEGFKERERDLRKWIRTYFLPMFDGLETVHAVGIVHRDMKPENVLLDGATPKITDFGIAGGPLWSHLTKSHHVEGTITYMAPEQFMDLGEADGRADVYALGKMLYEAVEGKMVDSKTACPLRGVCLSNPSTPFLKELDLIIQQATAEDKEKRIPSVGSLREALESFLEKAEASDRPLLKGFSRKEKIFIVALIAFFIGLVIVSNILHHYYMLDEEEASMHHSATGSMHGPAIKNKGQGASTLETKFSGPVLLGKDGSTMRLVPAGEVTISDLQGRTHGPPLKVSQFYMDETEVTNADYVEFLNQVLPKLTVKDGVVRNNGHIWLFLGPVYGGYEPIIFRDGIFLLREDSFASYPIVRVTGYGAAAYARFYGKRLPTESQWLQAIMQGKDNSGHSTKSVSTPETSQLEKDMEAWVEAYGSPDQVPENGSKLTASQIPYPVSKFGPDKLGIRGLEENVSEWGLRSLGRLKKAGTKDEYVVLGGLRGDLVLDSTLVPGVPQDPSNAFQDVGFRCVVAANIKSLRSAAP
ncbi:MAG: bifunctional serine/threonine-protein kinase/formylglycine-generating enzyme family protein [Desulfomonilaceae bacterium]